MTFLAPAFLWGLFAAALPVLIHLISLRNTREIEFSTLNFIKELEHETIRRLRLKQWLLVFLRVLIIVLLVLMFARPVQRGFASAWQFGEQDTRAVVFIDNSGSMSLKVDGRTLLDRTQNAVPQISAVFNEHTLLDIYQVCPPRRIFSGKSQDFQAISAVVQKIQPTQSVDHLWETVEKVLAEYVRDVPNLECFLISDFPDPPPPGYFSSSGPDSLNSWRFYCLTQPEVTNNVSIQEVLPVSRIYIPNQLVKLTARLTNDGFLAQKNVPVELFLDQERVGQVVTSLQPGAVKDFLFQAYLERRGIISGKLIIPDDDFRADNFYTFEIPVPEQIACTILSSDLADVQLIQTICNSINGDLDYLFYETRLDSAATSLFLDDTDILIMVNPQTLTAGALADIKDFQSKGGGVIWFAGDRAGVANHRIYERELSLPKVKSVFQLEGEAFYTVQVADPTHPVLADLVLRDLQDELPQVYGYVETEVSPGQRTVLELNNKAPFLIEIPSPGGNIFFFSSALDLRWNDLALRGFVIPLIHRILTLLATDETNTKSVLVDQQKLIDLDREILKGEWEVVTPSGNSILVSPDYTRQVLEVATTSELGSYRVYRNGELYTVFSTTLSPAERPSRRATAKELLEHLAEQQVRIIPPTDDLGKILQETRLGRSLWRTFLSLALVLLVVETAWGHSRTAGLKNRESDAGTP